MHALLFRFWISRGFSSGRATVGTVTRSNAEKIRMSQKILLLISYRTTRGDEGAHDAKSFFITRKMICHDTNERMELVKNVFSLAESLLPNEEGITNRELTRV